MVQFLPGRGFGAGFSEAFPKVLQDSLGKYLENKREGQLAVKKTDEQIRRDKAKIQEQEAAKGREFELYKKLLSDLSGDPQTNNLAENRAVQPTPEQNLPGITQTAPNIDEAKSKWERLTPEGKAIFAGRFPNESKQFQAELEHRQKQRFDIEKFEKGQVSESFKENQAFIDKSYDQYEDALRKDAILDRMVELQESGELSESGAVNLLEQIGFQPEWLKNPANEEFTKLGLDLLGGGTLQADYGSRVLQSEFQVAQQRIPTLLQTPEGRRQISENMRTMLLPSKLKKERMQFYLDQADRTGKPLPHNLRGKILADIKPQLEEAYDKFKQRNGRYKVKDGTFPDDNAIEKYYYLSKGNEKKAREMMEQDGYDLSQ